MKPIYRFLYLFFVLFLATACSDNEPALEPGAEDSVFSGPHSEMTLGAEASGLSATDIRINLMAEDGTEFSRQATHHRSGNTSRFKLSGGLADGTYRLLNATFSAPDAIDDDDVVEYGFGSRISVSDKGIEVIDTFNPTLGYAGQGTKDDPFIISGSSHLFSLMMTVNDYDTNSLITSDTYFRQVCNIDMKQMSRSCDMEYGWMPIGFDTNTPFRGVYMAEGHEISNLTINRPRSAGIGLFGYVFNASFDGLVMRKCTVTGQFAVGTVAGAVLTSGGNDRGKGTFTNCSAIDCTVSGPDTGAAIGGIVGAVDMHSTALMADCEVSGGSLSGGMNTGGILGGAGIFSSVMVSGCSNYTPVKSALSGAGGIVGTADTLQIVGCTNAAPITGGSAAGNGSPGIGTGGIVGGSGYAWITGAANTGEISGYEGVGGIIGSTRVKGSDTEAYVFNQALLRQCSNSARVRGYRSVGGAIGEAQAGAYAVYNTGDTEGTDYVGGICGNSSLAVIHNTVNSANITGDGYVGGILGKCTWGSLAISQNSGKVTGKSGHTAGIVALAGNNTVVHYCSNFGEIQGPASSPVGGIVGEIGDPRKWTAMNVAECVIGSMEIVMSVAGPILAVVEETVELAHAAEVVIKIVETSIEVSLQVADYSLLGYGISEMLNPEVEAELSAEMKERVSAIASDINSQLSTMRRACRASIPNFNNVMLNEVHAEYLDNLVSYYETEGNDELFNEAINEAREERAEALERISEAREIAHTVVAGVAVVCSTVALVGGSIASGGTATAFLLAGSAAAVVGGVNALVKTCTEFEHNAVVISQCINAAPILAPGNPKASSIVGHVYDGCLVSDCLNTAEVKAYGNELFSAVFGPESSVVRCVSLVSAGNFLNPGAVRNSLVCDPDVKAGQPLINVRYPNITVAAPADMLNPTFYDVYGFSVGDNSTWCIPAGYPFPIPGKSDMQK